MRDDLNLANAAALNHYLRTGRQLPMGCFVGHRSKGDGFDLSCKSWTTANFGKHYFTGNGRAVDLADVGLLDRFRKSSSVKRAVESFQEKQIYLAQQKANYICSRSENNADITVSLKDKDTAQTDVTYDIALFSVGDSTFFRSSNSSIDIFCLKRYLRLEGFLMFEIRDWFKNPVDVFDVFDDEYEVPKGVPYPIVASWQEGFRWEGGF